VDREPTVTDAARRIRDSLREYAKSKGWSPEEYRILMDYHAEWGSINLVMFSKEFHRINSDQIQNEMDYYNEIMDHLEKDFKDVPEIYEAIGLLLRPLDEYYIWGSRGAVGDLVEIDDHFMNPEVGPEELRGPIGSKF
jgi:hypothetical protein